ncbi:hypothetical protein KPL78_18195 [Roseomonas sp. HJA6]|uniref:Uncharacterized protein n=1 Tax=Roseomonas alba TaxID=2846776 RepID=A0ABS7ACL2_9PROT|nr:hypothetical protein [Neoroseomonas alba]MBW6399795.1 hypothetical protein [Neoroseomonas alba]
MILADPLPSLPPARAPHMAAILMTVFKGLATVSRERPAVRGVLIAETKAMVGLYLAAAAKPDG